MLMAGQLARVDSLFLRLRTLQHTCILRAHTAHALLFYGGLIKRWLNVPRPIGDPKIRKIWLFN